MKVPVRSVGFIVLAIAMGTGFASECPVTEPGRYEFQNDALRVVLPSDKRFVFSADSAGFIDQHGALGIKVGWERKIQGQLDITGRRLDGEAPKLRAWIPDGYADTGFQSSYVLFPKPGCWEIVASVGSHQLVFVVAVELNGPGPSWRLRGPDRGWRETGG